MSSNPQGEPWLSDKPIPIPVPPFREPAPIQAKKDYIPDDWEDEEDEDDEDGGQTGHIIPTGLQATADMPVQPQSRGEEIAPPIAAASSGAAPMVKKTASLAAPYGDLGPSLPSFEPVVRIFKRTTNPTGATAAPPTTSSPQKSLVEREREYQQARERIFGSPSTDAVSSGDNTPKDLGVPSVVQRQPRGPSSGDAVGFRR